MNDSDLRFGSNKDNVYHATTNLNTVIDNPEVNLDSTMGVNIQDLDNDISFGDNNLNKSYDENSKLMFNNSQQLYSPNGINSYSETVIQSNGSNIQAEFISGNTNNMLNDNTLNNEEKLDNNVVYEPALKKKKKPGSGLVISKEVKAMVFIIFILLLFIFVIPYVYDFLKELDLVIINR